MRPRNIYSNNVLRVIRYMAIATLIILLTTVAVKVFYLFGGGVFQDYLITKKIMVMIHLLLCGTIITFSIILIKSPQKLFLIGIGSLLFSILMSVVGRNSYMCILMYSLSYATFLLRFDSRKYKKLTFLIFLPVIIFEFLAPLMDSLTFFIDMTIQKIGVIFALFLIIYFFSECAKQKSIKQNTEKKVLNLADYEGLERSDLFLLQDVMDNVRYKNIAEKINGSEGALRNKLSQIYKILEVGDKIGFITIYSGYDLIYEPGV